MQWKCADTTFSTIITSFRGMETFFKPRRATGVEPATPGIQVCVSASRSCALVPRAIVASKYVQHNTATNCKHASVNCPVNAAFIHKYRRYIATPLSLAFRILISRLILYAARFRLLPTGWAWSVITAALHSSSPVEGSRAYPRQQRKQSRPYGSGE